MEQRKSPITIGDTFGLLTVEGSDTERPHRWLCRCQCGGKSCGCLARKARAWRALDLTGQRFGRLTALEPTEERQRTSVVWRCRCDCGKEVLASTTKLTGGIVQSCGCLQAYQRKKNMAAAIHIVDGTCVERIACQKETAANTSGHRGVSRRKNGTWRACMDFQGKRYDLGTYHTLEEAVAARLEGEKMYQAFLKNYYAGQQASPDETPWESRERHR